MWSDLSVTVGTEIVTTARATSPISRDLPIKTQKFLTWRKTISRIELMASVR